MTDGAADEPAWLHIHAHESNPTTPEGDATLVLSRPDGTEAAITPADLAGLPAHVEADCLIVSTGHPVSGPYTFGGVRLVDLIRVYVDDSTSWRHADVISADDYGNRVNRAELETPGARAILLATQIDGQAMTRQQGLVRLIVPDEKDDALRQVKWVARIEVR